MIRIRAIKLFILIICFVCRVQCSAQRYFIDANIEIKVQGIIKTDTIETKSEFLNVGFLKTMKLICRVKYLNLISKIKDSVNCKFTVKKIKLITIKKIYYCDLISVSTVDSSMNEIFKELTNDSYYDCFNGEHKTQFGYIFIQSMNQNEVQAIKIRNRSQKEIYQLLKRE